MAGRYRQLIPRPLCTGSSLNSSESSDGRHFIIITRVFKQDAHIAQDIAPGLKCSRYHGSRQITVPRERDIKNNQSTLRLQHTRHLRQRLLAPRETGESHR